MLRKILLALCVLLVGLFDGCSEQDNILSSETNSPLDVVIVYDGKDSIIVVSPVGAVYTEQALEDVVRIAAKENKPFKTSIDIATLNDIGDKPLQTDYQLAAPPKSSLVRIFISDLKVVNDGMAITLTDVGLNLGLSWQGAWTLACYAMFEYELQNPSCSKWPSAFYQAVRAQVRLEIYYHCLAYFYWPSSRFRTVNVVIGSLP